MIPIIGNIMLTLFTTASIIIIFFGVRCLWERFIYKRKRIIIDIFGKIDKKEFDRVNKSVEKEVAKFMKKMDKKF